MARKKKKKTAAKRGGRKPGKWEHVRPEEIKAYRGKEGISRAKLAAQLGVSTTSIQNWEAGRPASVKVQRELRQLFDGNPVVALSVESPASSGLEADSSAIRTTGSIVAAYLQSQKATMPPAELAKLVRSVRLALS